MKMTSTIEQSQTAIATDSGFAVDTTFVLFFLALEFGRTLGFFGIDTAFLGLTLLAVVVLPYFLPADAKPDFASWFLGRSAIAGLAILLGAMFQQALGAALPEMFRFLPMTLLIVTAMLSCYIQFYGLLKMRLSR